MRFLRNWRLKATVQSALSRVPGGAGINDRLQRVAGGLRDFHSNVATKVDDWCGIAALLSAVGRADVRGRDIAEVGTGWYPTLPLCFVLGGARSVLTVDLTRHLSEEMTFKVLAALEPHLGRISAACGVPLEDVRARYLQLRSHRGLESLLRAAGIRYEAPQDAAQLAWLADRSLDIVYSNSVLEHVAVHALGPIMQEAARVLKPDGLMVHAVACNDHYAHFDKSISFVNYLVFDERQWQRWNNAFHYQNRLRAPDFLRMAESSGFMVLHERRAVRPGTMEALSKMRIAPQFAHYSREDLATTTVDFIAAKATGAMADFGDGSVLDELEVRQFETPDSYSRDGKGKLRVS